MQVTLINYVKGQTISHSKIILLKGYLECADGEKSSKPLFIKTDIKATLRNSSVRNEVLQVRSFKNRFLLLVDLEPGQNFITFRYKTTNDIITEFPLKYELTKAQGELAGKISNINYIKSLYVVCSDRAKTDETTAVPEGNEIVTILKKINLGIRFVQALFAEKLFDSGFYDRRSFSFVDCELFETELGSQEILDYDTKHLWEYLAKEIRRRDGTWDIRCKYVAFVAMPWQSHQSLDLEPKGAVHEAYLSSAALGGGGLALLGSQFLQVWPQSSEEIFAKIIDSTSLSDSMASLHSFGRTVGTVYAASLGGLAHEMGHIFDLGHTERGLMGNQYHRIDLSLSPVLSYPPKSFLLSATTDQAQVHLCPKVGLPNGQILEDCVSLSFSCATLLFYHRWFRQDLQPVDTEEPGPVIIKDKIVSRAPLTAVEVRDLDQGRILKCWTLDVAANNPADKTVKPTYEFPLSKSYIPLPNPSTTNPCMLKECAVSADVVAQDSNGRIFKATVDRDSLPERYTMIRRRCI